MPTSSYVLWRARTPSIGYGELEISVASVGYRSAFVGAVLQAIPGTTTLMRPLRVRLADRTPQSR